MRKIFSPTSFMWWVIWIVMAIFASRNWSTNKNDESEGFWFVFPISMLSYLTKTAEELITLYKMSLIASRRNATYWPRVRCHACKSFWYSITTILMASGRLRIYYLILFEPNEHFVIFGKLSPLNLPAEQNDWNYIDF